MHVLPIPIFKFENVKVDRILEYSYIVQIAKGRASPVFAFNMQTADKVECLILFCMLKANI